jgi:hypothetical protein
MSRFSKSPVGPSLELDWRFAPLPPDPGADLCDGIDVSSEVKSALAGPLQTQTSRSGRELSGPAWVRRFPTSRSIDDLAEPFRTNMRRFTAALQRANATMSISATYRPRERAYLMHWAYRVARGTVRPEDVPPYTGIDIEWAHPGRNGTVDEAASRTAARAMVSAYRIVYQPSLLTRHERRLAIDMNVSWRGALHIQNAAGEEVVIQTSPRTQANPQLHAVAATYGVIKLVSDPPHWSDNGR